MNVNKRRLFLNAGIFTLLTICVPVFSLQAQDSTKAGFLYQSKSMAERWELGPENHKGFFLITPYRPVYVTAGRWSDDPNEQPTSENPSYSQPFKTPYNHYEAKFQLSFKTKIARRIFWGNGDLWMAFTQKSHWQVYNTGYSRPFRELNYEPELILNFATNYNLFGFKGRMLGIIFNHQSNGKDLPLSRSWNRIIFQAGFEKDNWQVTLRPWIRLKDTEDENPAILDYTGRGEAIVVFSPGKHQFSSVMGHSFNFKNGWGRGSIQLNWVFPVVNNLKGHIQFSEGYGETMLDYNHSQTTLGLGVSLVNW